MKSPNHWAAFSQSATGLQGCEFEWAGLALAGHLMSKGYHGNVKREKKGGGIESRARSNRGITVTADPALSRVCVIFACSVVCLHDYLRVCLFVCVCVCVCQPTSPGIVIVGHSVCGLDGGEAGLQGEQLTGQVWHTAGSRTGEEMLILVCCVYVTRKDRFHNDLIYNDSQSEGLLLQNWGTMMARS